MLIDFFFVLIVSFSVYGLVVQPIFNNLPSTKEVETEYKAEQDSMMEVILNTHLQKKDSSDNLIAVSTEAESYVKKLVRYSCSFYSDVSYYELEAGEKVYKELKDDEKLSYVDADGNYTNDEILFYYLNYRNDNSSFYKTTNDNDSLELVNKNLFKLDSDNKDLIENSFDLVKDVFYLDKNSTTILLDYINYGSSSGSGLYNRVKNLYRTIVMNAISDVETNNNAYIEKMTSFKAVYQKYSGSLSWSLLISYIIGFFLCYVPFQLIFKFGRTIGYRFFSLASLRNDLMDVKFINVFIKDLIIFVESMFALFFMALMLGKISLLSAPLFLSVNLMQFCIFSFLLFIVSLIFFFISKDSQTLSEFASLTYTVDVREKEESFMIQQEKDDNGKQK